MTDFVAQIGAAPLDSTVVRIALAGALGMFLGLEREWSQKSAGIRTFSLISLLAAVFTILDRELLLVVGGLLIIVQGVLLAVQGLRDEDKGLSLTTSTSMLVAYGVGSLVASGFIIEGVTVAVLSSLLLVLKRELHSFAWGLSREEVRSTSEFAILAFVIFPLLPSDPIGFDLNGTRIAAEPQVVWLMVVTVAGIGIANYAIVKSYGGRGIAVTGFFGGLASSTAVVGTMMDHVRQRPDAASYAVAAILLADAAMALRNLVIAIGFTLSADRVLVGAAVPLGAVILGSVLVAAYTADWSQKVEMKLDNPFSLRNALGFGAMFLVIIVAGGLAEAQFGTIGFYVTAILSGLVSSAGVTTSTVVLYRTGGLDYNTAIIAILLATASSIVVKAGLVAFGPSRKFAMRVGFWSGVLLVAATLMTALVTF
ncbi:MULTISPECIES: MgtC/SapB family protein [unclassified Haladaptatus]|uniref:MgtC/SapB family protein n=1 Tax=unclassified Haladaptatus TaxID=2622732 RepID=UPI0023E8F3DA|nr:MULTISPECIES: MgtC/SapB family protein [unclassified Haladaptatus]